MRYIVVVVRDMLKERWWWATDIKLGFLELFAKNLQIMHNDFKDYARTFCQLCAPSQTLDFLHCLAKSAALTLAEWIIASFWPFQVLIH